MANYREKDRKKKAAAATENKTFSFKGRVQQDIYLLTKKSLLVKN
jgi:hypothetical protein